MLSYFENIIKNYPNLKYIDTIFYYKAWVLDRKIKDYDRAIQEYNNFLAKFSLYNLWAPEVLYNLSLIYITKAEFHKVLYYTTKYLTFIKNGYYTPVLYTYKLVALYKTNQTNKFKFYLHQAMSLFKKQMVIIYDKNDNVSNYLSFETFLNLTFYSQNINVSIE